MWFAIVNFFGLTDAKPTDNTAFPLETRHLTAKNLDHHLTVYSWHGNIVIVIVAVFIEVDGVRVV